jgi:hypothetical protein
MLWRVLTPTNGQTWIRPVSAPSRRPAHKQTQGEIGSEYRRAYAHLGQLYRALKPISHELGGQERGPCVGVDLLLVQPWK